MIEQSVPRTRLEQVLWQRHLTLEAFRKQYQRVDDVELSERQAYRWVTGEMRGLPYPRAQATLEKMFGKPVDRWGGTTEANHTERLALDALDAYATASAQDRDFAAGAGIRGALALARVSQDQVDGAAEALAPVLDLPSSQRINKIVTSMDRVRAALSAIKDPGRDAIELAGAIEGWTAERLTQAR